MKFLVLNVLLCLAVVMPASAENNDSIQSTETNLIAFCANNSDVVAHVKVSSMSFVRKPTAPDVIDLSVCGRLFTFQVKHAYLREDCATSFPTNIYLFKRGMMSASFLEPILHVGQEYLVFLKREKTPEIVNSGVVTVPLLPTTNFFTFIHLPQRQIPNRKAYVEIMDTNTLISVEKCLTKSMTTQK